MKRLALLICDTPAPSLVTKFGDYKHLFTLLLQHPSITIDSFDVTAGIYPKDPSIYDSFLMTGSMYSAYDDVEWIHKLVAFIRQIDSTNQKIVGICFGHQLLAHALGGKGN
jgi:GMP synthase-like glutamine amidotransferase